ncbi:MAG: hypothetical protein V7727_00240 [Sneathiella sp.]
MTDKQITKDIPGGWLLDVHEARIFLRLAYGLNYTERNMRRIAASGTLPFFKLNPKSKTEKYYILADDIRKHIMLQRTKAVNRSAA